MMKREQLNLRIDPKLAARLRAVTVNSKKRYAPKMSEVVQRGIELALREIGDAKDNDK